MPHLPEARIGYDPPRTLLVASDEMSAPTRSDVLSEVRGIDPRELADVGLGSVAALAGVAAAVRSCTVGGAVACVRCRRRDRRRHPAYEFRGMSRAAFRPMRTWLVTATMALVGACATDAPLVSCVCPYWWEKAAVEGAFVATVELEVESGAYVPPTPPAASEAIASFDEDTLTIAIAEHHLAFRVAAHAQLEPTGEPDCCGQGLRLVEDGGPWSERNMARIDWSLDEGDSFAGVDPSVEAESTIPTEAALLANAPVVLDADGLGLTVRTWYLVRATGCTNDACASTVRVERHLRRR